MCRNARPFEEGLAIGSQGPVGCERIGFLKELQAPQCPAGLGAGREPRLRQR